MAGVSHVTEEFPPDWQRNYKLLNCSTITPGSAGTPANSALGWPLIPAPLSHPGRPPQATSCYVCEDAPAKTPPAALPGRISCYVCEDAPAEFVCNTCPPRGALQCAECDAREHGARLLSTDLHSRRPIRPEDVRFSVADRETGQWVEVEESVVQLPTIADDVDGSCSFREWQAGVSAAVRDHGFGSELFCCSCELSAINLSYADRLDMLVRWVAFTQRCLDTTLDCDVEEIAQGAHPRALAWLLQQGVLAARKLTPAMARQLAREVVVAHKRNDTSGDTYACSSVGIRKREEHKRRSARERAQFADEHVASREALETLAELHLELVSQSYSLLSSASNARQCSKQELMEAEDKWQALEKSLRDEMMHQQLQSRNLQGELNAKGKAHEDLRNQYTEKEEELTKQRWFTEEQKRGAEEHFKSETDFNLQRIRMEENKLKKLRGEYARLERELQGELDNTRDQLNVGLQEVEGRRKLCLDVSLEWPFAAAYQDLVRKCCRWQTHHLQIEFYEKRAVEVAKENAARNEIVLYSLSMQRLSTADLRRSEECLRERIIDAATEFLQGAAEWSAIAGGKLQCVTAVRAGRARYLNALYGEQLLRRFEDWSQTLGDAVSMSKDILGSCSERLQQVVSQRDNIAKFAADYLTLPAGQTGRADLRRGDLQSVALRRSRVVEAQLSRLSHNSDPQRNAEALQDFIAALEHGLAEARDVQESLEEERGQRVMLVAEEQRAREKALQECLGGAQSGWKRQLDVTTGLYVYIQEHLEAFGPPPRSRLYRSPPRPRAYRASPRPRADTTRQETAGAFHNPIPPRPRAEGPQESALVAPREAPQPPEMDDTGGRRGPRWSERATPPGTGEIRMVAPPQLSPERPELQQLVQDWLQQQQHRNQDRNQDRPSVRELRALTEALRGGAPEAVEMARAEIARASALADRPERQQHGE
eukprot:Hpha_TRINITY_DN2034_c0_g1::TRINITY_DN2034_c0_g1_i1::g.83050::m.83050